LSGLDKPVVRVYNELQRIGESLNEKERPTYMSKQRKDAGQALLVVAPSMAVILSFLDLGIDMGRQ
jgi:hypothetical protein